VPDTRDVTIDSLTAAGDGVAAARRCTREVVDEVFGRLQPGLAVYVSCNPEALARDVAGIARHGYNFESIQPVDMFPHTAHVEAVVVLTR
jgi:23S rRNA (uracil1939-C5)-methyltransferase